MTLRFVFARYLAPVVFFANFEGCGQFDHLSWETDFVSAIRCLQGKQRAIPVFVSDVNEVPPQLAYENAIGNKDGAIESGDDEEGKKKFALWMKCFKEDREGQLEFLRGQVKKISDLTPEEADLVPFNAIVEICEKGFEACILEVKRIQREINGLTSESQLFHRHKTFMEDLEDRIDLQEMYLSISEVKREERDVEKKMKDE